jgi:hypothetical protein
MNADMLNRGTEDRPHPPSLSLSFRGGRLLLPLWIRHCGVLLKQKGGPYWIQRVSLIFRMCTWMKLHKTLTHFYL